MVIRVWSRWHHGDGAVDIMVGGWERQGGSSKRGSSFYPCRIKPDFCVHLPHRTTSIHGVSILDV